MRGCNHLGKRAYKVAPSFHGLLQCLSSNAMKNALLFWKKKKNTKILYSYPLKPRILPIFIFILWLIVFIKWIFPPLNSSLKVEGFFSFFFFFREAKNILILNIGQWCSFLVMEFLWVCTVSFIFHQDVIAYVILPLRYRLYSSNESFPHALTLGSGVSK